MNRLAFPLTLSALLVALASSLPAGQIRIPIDTNTSTMTVELCVGALPPERCDSETHPLRGFLLIALEPGGLPSQIALRDFDAEATADYNLRIDYSFLGSIEAVARNMRIYHARPGPTNPFAAITGDQFLLQDVPSRTTGTASYDINGFVCTVVGASFPCSSNIDLATLGENIITNLPGTIQIANGMVHVAMDLTFSAPLDETNPGLGRLGGHAIIRGSAPLSQAIVPTGADWRYLDDGSDPGVAWRAPAFDDAAWKLGAAQLGYGDGDETTVVNFGPDPTFKFITTYFRRAFLVPDPAAYTNLALELLRDDGAVVYLNGTEIFRSNLPTGAVTAATLAVNAVGGAEETNFFTTFLGSSRLLRGTNVLAVEVHQSGPTSTDLSFDLALLPAEAGAPPSVSLIRPAAGTVFAAGRPVVLEAQATGTDCPVARVEFFAGTNRIGEAPQPPFELTWTNPVSGLHALTARAVDVCGSVGDSAPVPVNVGTFAMISPGAVWKYVDNGSDQGTGWRSLYFDDSLWAQGPAQLGYGDGDESTVVYSGPDATNKFITTYFRRFWTVLDRSLISGLTLRLLRDDGAVVYLNGIEVHRSNMPTGTVASSTLALVAVSDAEERTFLAAPIVTTYLRTGTNLLAVEIHQNGPASTDVSFDLELLAATRPSRPRLAIQLDGDTCWLRWPSGAVGYRLESARGLNSPALWQPVAQIPLDDGAWKSLRVATSAGDTFYRLVTD